jgi:enamine deaminase RidA (YjgF/YER057c/UK114 family)
MAKPCTTLYRIDPNYATAIVSPSMLNMMPKPVEVIDPPELGARNPLYSAMTSFHLSPTAVQYNISGQVGQDPNTNEVPAAISSQFDMCLRRISICLDHIGAQKDNIVTFMYYVKESAMSDMDDQNGDGASLKMIVDKAGQWLEGHRPASCFSRIFGMSHEKYLCEVAATVVMHTDAAAVA